MTVNGKNYNNLNNKYPQGTPGNATYPPIAFVPAQNKISTLAPGQTYTFEVKLRWTYKTNAAALQKAPPSGPATRTSPSWTRARPGH